MLTTLAPLPVAVPGLKVISYGTATAYPCGISNDRATVYGSAFTTGGVLYQSTDHGATWTSVKTFGTGTSEVVFGLLETDDGEALVYTQAAAASPGYIYKSTGWSTSHTTATWTKVLTTTGGWIEPKWSGNSFSFGDDTIAAGTSKIGVTSEYGTQTTVTFNSGNANTTDLTRARRVYLTQDYGTTWTQILDLSAFFPAATGLHVHAAAYDPYWRRIWVTFGDNQAAGAGTLDLLYSDDLGATWTAVPVTTGSNDAWQSTSLAILRDAIVLASDNNPGIIRLPRTGFRTLGAMQFPVIVNGNTGSRMIGMGVHRNRKQAAAPLLTGIYGAGDTDNPPPPAAYISLDGQQYVELWRDQFLKSTATGGSVDRIVGPTTNGTILARVDQTTSTSGVKWLLRGELVNLGPGWIAKQATFTSTASQTVYNIPHGLTAAPRLFRAWDTYGTLSASTITVTADATNIIVTLGAALTTGTKVALTARYAP